ncbi:MAG: hypothetical protein HKO06_09290 [Pseudomonadales bacterium]|nr:hypothetical protein [Pseudomonadales bacterium]
MSNYFRRMFTHKTAQFYGLLSVLVVLPVLFLAGLGLLYVWQQGWSVEFMLVLFVFAVVLIIAARLARPEKPEVGELVESLAPKPDWSARDQQVWQQAKQRIVSEELLETPWSELQSAMMSQLTYVANCYHQGAREAEFAVTLPEFLLMLETCSRNYRALILKNAPVTQRVKISTVRSVYRHKDTISGGVNALHWGYRALRMVISAPSAVVSEARGAITGSVFDELSGHMQNNLKKMLFEEVSQVAIDLYSGRLKLSDEELHVYQQQLAKADARAREKAQKSEAANTRPLTVVVIGQVNAGKSSLVNALAEQSLSEIDVIQAGNKALRHRLQLSEALEIELVDTPGINGEKKINKLLLAEATQADLVLWLSAANQPAKELDKQLVQAWQAYFSKHIARRQPPILLVTTHNDLLKPAAEWQPPYDLNDTASRKASMMLEALHYTQQVLELPADTSALPVCLAADKGHYNVDALRELIAGMSEDARASQLNRHRVEAGDSQPLAKAAWTQLIGMGRVVGQVAFKREGKLRE